MFAPRTAFLIVALLFTNPVDLSAQQEPFVLQPGDRVRVSAAHAQLYRSACTVLELRLDTLVVDRGGALALPLGSITALDVSRGRKSYTLLGAGIGFAVGFIPLYALCQAGSCGDMDDGVTACCLEIGTMAGALGGLVGGLIGSVKHDQWEEVPLDRLRVSIVPHRNKGIAIIASFRLRQR